jgi:hypothetical protein
MRSLNDGKTSWQRYREKHRERINALERSPETRKQRRDIRDRNKKAVIDFYSNGEGTCRWCGHSDLDVLCLDHINDDGQSYRRGGRRRGGSGFYSWIIAQGYPPGLQVLCANCNTKKEVVRRRQLANLCSPARPSA